MNKSKFLLLIFLFLGLTFLSSCSSNNPLPEYSYKYNRIDNFVCDNDMKIDGILEEENYNNKKHMSFANYNVNVHLTTHFGDLGLYVGLQVEDNFIFYNADYNMNANSSIELKITREDVIKNDNNILHFQVDAKNKRQYTYFLLLAASKVEGEEINSGESQGMTFEVFIPWSQLKLSSKPEKVKIMPGYNHVTSSGADVTPNWIRPSGNVNNPNTFYLFDENGYINADAENVTLGDSITGISKTNGWDLSKLTLDNPEVKTNANNAQFIFFKNANSNKYSIETTVYPITGIDDPLPKAGLMIGYNDIAKSAFLIDIREDFLKSNRVSVKVINFFQTWEATDYVYTTYDLDFSQGIKLRVIKDEAIFYYYVNDILVYINEITYLKDEALPGLFSLGAEVSYTDFNYIDYSTDEELLQNNISQSAYMVKINSNLGGIVHSTKPAIIKTIDSKKMLLDNLLEVTVLPSIEFRLTKFTIKFGNQEPIDMLETLKSNLNNGKYTIEVTDNIEIDVEFTRLSKSVITYVSGSITNEDVAIRPTNTNLTIIGYDDKTLIYTPILRYLAASKEASYTIALPEGKYYFRYMLDNHQTQTILVDVYGTSLEVEDVYLSYRSVGGKVQGKTDGIDWVVSSSINWDYSTEEQNIIQAMGTANLYFNEQLSNKFLLSTNISKVTSLNNYDLKAGIIVASYMKNGELIRYCVMIDERSNKAQSYVALLKITSNHSWTNHQYESLINITGEGNKLTVVRDGSNIVVFLDNNYLTTFTIDTEEEAAFGFQTIGSTAIYSSYTYSYDETLINDLLNQIQ